MCRPSSLCASPVKRLLAVFLLLAVAGPLSGCSYAFVHGPGAPGEVKLDERGRALPPSETCTTSNALPIVDTVLGVPAVGAGLLAFLIAGSGECNGGWCGVNTEEVAAAGVALAAVGALFLASAVSGYGRTADCRGLDNAQKAPPQRSERYLLDVRGIAAARSTTTESAR